MADDETELMLRVAAGDDAAYETLVVRILPRLEGYFRRMGADPTLAEDCAQEVFVKVYKARASYVARAKFTTYLFHIARNHWIDVYRHRKAQPPTVPVDRGGDDGDRRGAGDLPGPDAAPEETLRGQEITAALERAVEALGAEHREVFVLSQVEGLRYQEIGRILDIPVGTVKSRMHAAVRQVRRALEREGIEPQ